MDNVPTLSDDARILLEAAGYDWNDDAACWWHPRLRRALDGDVACVLTLDQLMAWIRST